MPAATTTTHHRVLMTDVDLVQVNFTRMFLWMDHGFTQLLHDLGHPSSALLRQGWSTPVVDSHCNHRRPVTLDDEFHLVTRVIEVGRSSFVVGHDFIDEAGLFARGECRHVWIRTHPYHTPIAVPDWIRESVVPRDTVPTGNGGTTNHHFDRKPIERQASGGASRRRDPK
jgi:YbgC/YbaW family acyl-CoA thioester hydrolase